MAEALERTKRYFLELSYKGTQYHGWQTQRNAIAVQDVVQKAFSQLMQGHVAVVGSSRTDTGVHAKVQFAHVDLPTSFAPSRLIHRLNALTPPDIVLHRLIPVDSAAHARFDALHRCYTYYILRKRSAFCSETHWCMERELNVDAMRRAAHGLVGRKNFAKLSKRGSDNLHHWCSVDCAQWAEHGDLLVFHIRANRFLRGMVRFIVGALWQVGTGQLSFKTWQTLLDGSCRLTPKLAPPHGLFLTQICYPARIFAHAPPSNFSSNRCSCNLNSYEAAENFF